MNNPDFFFILRVALLAANFAFAARSLVQITDKEDSNPMNLFSFVVNTTAAILLSISLCEGK